MVKLMEEDEEQADEGAGVGEGSPTGGLVPKQVLVPWAAMPVAPRFWAADPSDQAARRGLTTSSRAQAKAPAIQAELLPPAEVD